MEWWTALESWMIWLCRVHTVLDLVAITESVLNISTQSIMPITSNALRFYFGEMSPIQSVMSIKDLPIQIFRSPINTHFVEHHIPKYIFIIYIQSINNIIIVKILYIFLFFFFPEYSLMIVGHYN